MNAAEGIQRLLVIRTDRIGDVVLTIPAIHALRRHFPQAKIFLLVAPLTVDLVDGHPDLDGIMIDDRNERHKGWLGFWRLVSDVRAKKFDAVINFHTKKRTNLLCFLSRIPRRIGYKNNKFGFLLTDQIKDERPDGLRHEVHYCLKLLKTLGIDDGQDVQLFLPLHTEAVRWVEDFFQKMVSAHPGSRCVVLHLGASCPTKRWPVQYFADLITLMSSRWPVGFVVIGTADHRDLVDDLRRLTGPALDICDLTGRLSLAHTAALLKQCSLLISNDSGPVHIAAAFGTPVVSIFTRNQPGINPERWRPLGKNSYYVAPPLERTFSFAKGEVEDHSFLYRVTPQQVFEVVDAVF